MQEHERYDYERLRREGKWQAANAYRESVRRELRRIGINRRSARSESWLSMLEKFPRPKVRPSAPGGNVFHGPEVINGRLVSELSWVLAALQHSRAVSPDEAPSGYTADLLATAQRERFAFLFRILRIILSKPDEVKALLPEMEKVAHKWERESTTG